MIVKAHLPSRKAFLAMDAGNYRASSEPYQGKFRAKVINPNGKVSWFSQITYMSEGEATRAAQDYITQKISTGNYD